MFEKFRKNLADTAKELPKEERKEFLEDAQQSETYQKAKAEHLEQAQMTQEKWGENLIFKEKLDIREQKKRQVIRDIFLKINDLKMIGADTFELKKQLEKIEKQTINKTIEINGVLLELGPTLDPMEWDKINTELDKRNKSLKEGEKPWRVPSEEEFQEIANIISLIHKDPALTQQQSSRKAAEALELLGFSTSHYDGYYWSSSENEKHKDKAWYWHTEDSQLYSGYKDAKYLVRLVR